MPYADKAKQQEYQRAYSKKYYQANRDIAAARTRESNQRYRARNKEYIDELRSTTPCTDCGKFYPPYVMDFDHLDADEKSGNVGDLAVRQLVSLETLKAEIAKTEIVCSNCHRERTHQRRQELSVTHCPLV